jgi:hypothetical protein
VNKSWSSAVLLGMALVGCGSSPVAEADPVAFTLNEAFRLPGGMEAATTGDDLRLRFTDVLEDSRCPTEVECFWTGQARIAIQVQPAGREPTTTEFNTNPAPGQTILTARAGEYTITLQQLDPYPRTIDESPVLEDYTATLSVQKAAS